MDKEVGVIVFILVLGNVVQHFFIGASITLVAGFLTP